MPPPKQYFVVQVRGERKRKWKRNGKVEVETPTTSFFGERSTTGELELKEWEVLVFGHSKPSDI